MTHSLPKSGLVSAAFSCASVLLSVASTMVDTEVVVSPVVPPVPSVANTGTHRLSAVISASSSDSRRLLVVVFIGALPFRYFSMMYRSPVFGSLNTVP